MASPAKADEYVAPSSPAMYLAAHIAQKGFQLGSVVGVAAVIPALVVFKKQRDPVALLKAMGTSAAGGLAVAGGMAAFKFPKIDQAGFEDRAYRLHYNAGQQRTDVFSAAGMLAGLVAAAVLLPRGTPGYSQALTGAMSVGTALGVLAHVATKPQEQRAPSTMVHELKRTD